MKSIVICTRDTSHIEVGLFLHLSHTLSLPFPLLVPDGLARRSLRLGRGGSPAAPDGVSVGPIQQ